MKPMNELGRACVLIPATTSLCSSWLSPPFVSPCFRETIDSNGYFREKRLAREHGEARYYLVRSVIVTALTTPGSISSLLFSFSRRFKVRIGRPGIKTTENTLVPREMRQSKVPRLLAATAASRW